jgi:peptide/nickel transport system substrate-binding protein
MSICTSMGVELGLGGLVRRVAPLVVGLFMAASGCAPSAPVAQSPAPAAPPTIAATAAAATLVIDKSFDQQTADTGRDNSTTGRMIFRAIYDTLLTFNSADISKPDPWLAASYTMSDDAKTFTFKLRDGVAFSDGTPLTSADVVFSYNRLKNLKGGIAYLLDGVTITAPDPTTVVLLSDKPNLAIPYSLTNPSLGILNSKVVKANGGTDGPDAPQADKAQPYLNDNSAGSGRYILERFNTSDQVVLRANPSFWGTKPVYQRIVLRNVLGATQALNVEQGTSQVALDVPPDQLPGLQDKGLQVISGNYPTVWYFQANADSGVSTVTANPKFREAIRYGLDYESFLSLAGPGSKQACGIVHSLFPGALPDAECPHRDLARAKKALADSGLGSPVAKLEYPSDISINGLQFGPIAERIKAQLAEVGITVELAPAPLAPVQDRWQKGQTETQLWSTSARYPYPSHYLIFIPGRASAVAAGWKAGANPELEALGQKVETATNPADMAPLWQDIQLKMTAADAPYFPLFQSPRSVVAAKSVGNVYIHPTFICDISALGLS